MSKFKAIRGYVICIATFIILWQVAASIYGSAFFPTPLKVVSGLADILSNTENYKHIAYTTVRVLIAVLISSLIGSLMGILPAYSMPVKYSIDAVIYPVLQSVPQIAWAFLAVIWFGLSPITPIFIVSLSLFPIFILNMREGIKEVDRNLIELGESFTKSKLNIFKKIIFPSIYPYFFSALRIAFSKAWKIILIAELFGATNGIGYMLNMARDVYDVRLIFSWVVILCSMILIFDYGIFNHLDKKIMGRLRAKNDFDT